MKYLASPYLLGIILLIPSTLICFVLLSLIAAIIPFANNGTFNSLVAGLCVAPLLAAYWATKKQPSPSAITGLLIGLTGAPTLLILTSLLPICSISNVSNPYVVFLLPLSAGFGWVGGGFNQYRTSK